MNRHKRRVLAGVLIAITATTIISAIESIPISATGPVPQLAGEVAVAPPAVRYGDRNLYVAEIQQALTRGGWPTKADGIFGKVTLKTVKAFQRANGLTVDGIVGEQTRQVLGLIDAPATTPVPAVRVNPPAPPVTDPESIIREIWPDDLEDHAVAIAKRESDLQPEVINANGNATGLFQIMWTIHRSWLCPQLNICVQSDLQDARLNTTAAYALYQRDGGWHPWAL